MKCWDEDIKTRADYLKEWKANYPMESQWYHLSVSRYKGHTYLHMVENDHWWCQIHDDDDKHAWKEDLEWLLEPLAEFLREKVPEIAADVEAYNRHVDDHLPKRQRTGRIARKDLDRIVPWQRRRPRNVKKVIKMLKECIENEKIYRMTEPKWLGDKLEKPDVSMENVALPASYREPLPHMSIRIYAKYFRVAYMAYQEHFRHLMRRSRREREDYAEFLAEASALSDIEFYRRYQLGRHGEITDETDFELVARPNVRYLNNRSVVLGKTELFFTTLWTKIDPTRLWTVQQGMNDYRYGKLNGRRFCANDVDELHRQCMDWLSGALAASTAEHKVVVTHHCPTLRNEFNSYPGGALNSAFQVDLDAFIEGSGIEYWIYGHTHFAGGSGTKIGETTLLCNQLGVKSNRDSIKGVFAEKLREQISAARTEPQSDKAQAPAKTFWRSSMAPNRIFMS